MRALLLVSLVPGLLLAAVATADEQAPQRIRLQPESSAPTPVIELEPNVAPGSPAAQAEAARIEAWKQAVAAAAEASAKAREEAKLLPTDTLALKERAALLEERGIRRGEQIGGNAAIGIRLGSKGLSGELDVEPAVRDSVEKWDDLGALVLTVVPDSPAESAGLEPGDIVVQVGGIWIDTSDMLVRIASRLDVGREIEVRYLRLGIVQTTWLTAIDRRDLAKTSPQ